MELILELLLQLKQSCEVVQQQLEKFGDKIATMEKDINAAIDAAAEEISTANKKIIQEAIEVEMIFTPSVMIIAANENEAEELGSFFPLSICPSLLPFPSAKGPESLSQVLARQLLPPSLSVPSARPSNSHTMTGKAEGPEIRMDLTKFVVAKKNFSMEGTPKEWPRLTWHPPWKTSRAEKLALPSFSMHLPTVLLCSPPSTSLIPKGHQIRHLPTRPLAKSVIPCLQISIFISLNRNQTSRWMVLPIYQHRSNIHDPFKLRSRLSSLGDSMATLEVQNGGAVKGTVLNVMNLTAVVLQQFLVEGPNASGAIQFNREWLPPQEEKAKEDIPKVNKLENLGAFRRYRGGWDLAIRQYWISIGFTGAPTSILAVLWFNPSTCVLRFWCLVTRDGKLEMPREHPSQNFIDNVCYENIEVYPNERGDVPVSRVRVSEVNVATPVAYILLIGLLAPLFLTWLLCIDGIGIYHKFMSIGYPILILAYIGQTSSLSENHLIENVGFWDGLSDVFITKYYTSNAYKPVQDIADFYRDGLFGEALHLFRMMQKKNIWEKNWGCAVELMALYSLHRLSEGGLQDVDNGCKKLRSLTQSDCYFLDYRGLELIATGCEKLTHHEVNGCHNLGTMRLEFMGNVCPQFTELVLLFYQKISNDALLEVGRGPGCKLLQALHLVDCSHGAACQAAILGGEGNERVQIEQVEGIEVKLELDELVALGEDDSNINTYLFKDKNLVTQILLVPTHWPFDRGKGLDYWMNSLVLLLFESTCNWKYEAEVVKKLKEKLKASHHNLPSLVMVYVETAEAYPEKLVTKVVIVLDNEMNPDITSHALSYFQRRWEPNYGLLLGMVSMGKLLLLLLLTTAFVLSWATTINNLILGQAWVDSPREIILMNSNHVFGLQPGSYEVEVYVYNVAEVLSTLRTRFFEGYGNVTSLINLGSTQAHGPHLPLLLLLFPVYFGFRLLYWTFGCNS